MNLEFTKEAVLALVEEEMNHYDEYEDAKEFNVLYDIYESIKDMKDSSKELPRWIFHKSGDEDSLAGRLMSPGDYYSCPICFNSSNVMYNYCPSCGEKLGRANYGGENK